MDAIIDAAIHSINDNLLITHVTIPTYPAILTVLLIHLSYEAFSWGEVMPKLKNVLVADIEDAIKMVEKL